MADYRFKPWTTNDTTGIVRTADETEIPPNPNLGAWRDYLVWKAVPNTPDPAASPTLSSVKREKKRGFDGDARSQLFASLRLQRDDFAGGAFAHAALLEELYRYELLVVLLLTPTAANFPIFNALIGSEGADLAAVAGNIRTWYDTVKGHVGATIATNWQAHKDVNAAANKAAVEAVTATFSSSGAGSE